MPELPLVSVVMPAWNAERWVARAVDSALAQDHEPKEVIVVDDGSTDGTPGVLARYGRRIRVVRQPNRGLPAARNAGLHAARGELVAFLDADDRWLPGKLAAQVALMRERPELGFCATEAWLEDEAGRRLGRWRDEGPLPGRTFLETLFARNAAVAGSGSAVMVRRELALAVGGFDETLPALEDVDMWMRLAAVAAYACVPEPLAVVTRRAGSMSRGIARMKAAAVRVMRKNRRLLPPRSRGAYWRWCYAGMLTDYAKWEARAGRRARALLTLAQAAALSPLGRGRLAAAIALDVLRGRMALPEAAAA